MNSKTTLVLAIICAALGAGFYFVRGRDASLPKETFAPPTNPTQQTSSDLLAEDDKLGDAIRVEITRVSKDTLIFEKTSNATPAIWNMTAPAQMKVRSHEAEAFARNINNLKYEISYEPADANAVSESDAGLSPPAGTITVEDAAGKTVSVQVGKQVSKTERYVRLKDTDRICLGKTDLFSSLKSTALEYRDQTLWNIVPAEVTKIEVTDRAQAGDPIDYTFNKIADTWTMTSPVTAKTTNKVAEMVTALSRLRATKWEANAKGSLPAYGLSPATTTIKITTEKKSKTTVEANTGSDTDTEKSPAPEFKTETNNYTLHVSSRSPIGEDTKTYMRIGDETMVATLMKTTADKLKPVMAEWRDMRITTANIESASRITIDIAGESAAFTRSDKNWTFEKDGGKVEPSQLTKLLAAVKSLNAVAFVDTKGKDLTEFGLQDPKATIAITAPSLEGPLQIKFGNHTDPKTRRLVYVQKNSEPSIAKVRTSHADALLNKPLSYRDREILSLDPSKIMSIDVTSDQTTPKSSISTSFMRTDEKWRMTSPAEARADNAKLNILAAVFSNLKATAVVAYENEASAFGLHAPKINIQVVTQAGDPVQTKTVAFVATQHEGKNYLKRNDRPAIYEITPKDYNRLTAEVRSIKICSAKLKEVTAFRMTQGGNENGFALTDGKWTYQTEPDLPLDTEKVVTLLMNVMELRATRYFHHTPISESELSRVGMGRRISLTLADGTTWELDVSSKTDKISGEKAFVASVLDQDSVFLILESALKTVTIDLDNLESK